MDTLTPVEASKLEPAHFHVFVRICLSIPLHPPPTPYGPFRPRPYPSASTPPSPHHTHSFTPAHQPPSLSCPAPPHPTPPHPDSPQTIPTLTSPHQLATSHPTPPCPTPAHPIPPHTTVPLHPASNHFISHPHALPTSHRIQSAILTLHLMRIANRCLTCGVLVRCSLANSSRNYIVFSSSSGHGV